MGPKTLPQRALIHGPSKGALRAPIWFRPFLSVHSHEKIMKPFTQNLDQEYLVYSESKVGHLHDYALFREDMTMVLVKSWSYLSQRLVILVLNQIFSIKCIVK